MLKVAILDDYQNISHQFVDLKKLSGKYEIKVFSEPFQNEEEAIENLNYLYNDDSILKSFYRWTRIASHFSEPVCKLLRG